MSSQSILNIKPRDIDNTEKRAKYTISIIGCDSIGVFYSCLFAEAGFKVICVDDDQTTLNLLAKGKTAFLRHEMETRLRNQTKNGQIVATSDMKAAVSQSDVIVVTIPVRIDEKNRPDYSKMEKALKLTGSSLQRNSLVIVMSATGVGAMEGVITIALENASGYKAGIDFGLAYSPIHILHGQTLEATADNRRIVAATDNVSLNAASAILETVTRNGTTKTNDVKLAEATVLFEMARQDTNVALANEFALFCEKLGLDYVEAQKLAGTNTSDALFSPTLSDGCVREEPYLLIDDAENRNMKIRIVAIARETNEEIIKHASNLVKDALRKCGKTMRRAKICMLGISQTPNERSKPMGTLKDLVQLMETKGAKLRIYDPYFSEIEVAELQRHFRSNLAEAVEGADCMMIIAGHDQFRHLDLRKLKALMKMPAAIVDFEGVLEPDKVEKESFTYRGLGRGIWTK
jgi:UDP-N-acetyl-D-mannosaminuronic acid dehydrogenase